MSKENKEKEKTIKSGICPYCGSDDYTVDGFPDVGADVVSASFLCKNDECTEYWEQEYHIKAMHWSENGKEQTKEFK